MSEPGTGTAASAYSASEAASVEASSTAHSAASSKQDRTVSSVTVVLVVVTALFPFDEVSAVGTEVGDFLFPYSSALVEQPTGRPLKGVSAAMGALAGGTCRPDGCDDSYTDESDEEQDDYQYIIFLLLFAVVLHAAVQSGADGTDTCHHACVPIALLQIGHHVACLYALADGIGQVTFQSVAGIELDASLVGHQQDYQPVVLLFFSHPPFVEQLMAKVETRSVADAANYGHYRFDASLLFQVVEHPVNAVASHWRQNAIGIAGITPLVLEMYFRQVLRSIDVALRPDGTRAAAQQEQQDNRELFHVDVCIFR